MKPVSIASLILVAGIAASPALAQGPTPGPYFVGNPLGLPVNPAADGGFAPMSSNVKVFGAIYATESCSYDAERDLIGRPLADALALSDTAPLELVREWGVRRLGEQVELDTRAGFRKPVTADFFPAYDADGGLLVALTPR